MRWKRKTEGWRRVSIQVDRTTETLYKALDKLTLTLMLFILLGYRARPHQGLSLLSVCVEMEEPGLRNKSRPQQVHLDS